ncbi:MAG: lytic transglycosylase domain-containing protein [Spirochaetes bacterium]|nr:MAG: lytic transglycosylase domain-containing protein [Spirochaetota bacterium]
MTKLNAAGKDFLRTTGITYTGFQEVLSKWGLPEDLVLGIVWVESKGDPGALRHEPDYPHLWEVPFFAGMFHWTMNTEAEIQRFSFGLMQIMLATARWRGFSFHPKELFEPKTGLTWGCFHLSELYAKYKKWPDAVSAYNQGSPRRSMLNAQKFKNQAYVDKVFEAAKGYCAVVE